MWAAFGVDRRSTSTSSTPRAEDGAPRRRLRRTGELLTHPVFHRYHSEHELLRYLRRLADRTSRSTAR